MNDTATPKYNVQMARNIPKIDFLQAIDYEVRCSWWIQWIGWEPLQEAVARWLMARVLRRHKRYMMSKTYWERNGNP